MVRPCMSTCSIRPPFLDTIGYVKEQSMGHQALLPRLLWGPLASSFLRSLRSPTEASWGLLDLFSWAFALHFSNQTNFFTLSNFLYLKVSPLQHSWIRIHSLCASLLNRLANGGILRRLKKTLLENNEKIGRETVFIRLKHAIAWKILNLSKELTVTLTSFQDTQFQ